MNFINPDIALKKLEVFREELASLGRITIADTPDWAIRMCQHYIASLADYPDRATWVAKIKNLKVV